MNSFSSFQMDECNGQIGDLKRQQQQLLDRDGTSKLVDRIEGVELLLNTELMKVKGNLRRGVKYSKKRVRNYLILHRFFY